MKQLRARSFELDQATPQPHSRDVYAREAAGAAPNPGGAARHIVTDQRQFLTFLLGKETFGLSILSVKEIIGYGRLTAVPLMPASVRGMINLRGSVVPVIDLAARFGMSAQPVTKRSCIVIVETARRGEVTVMGIVVDAVNAVVTIADDEIEQPPAFGTNINTDFIAGMGRVEDRFIILLAAEDVLDFDEPSNQRDVAEFPA